MYEPKRTVELADLGDWHPHVVQLRCAHGLFTLETATSSLAVPGISSEQDLRQFLRVYVLTWLLPRELPSIYHAYHHANRRHYRELIQLDRRLGREMRTRGFSTASQRLGQYQLKCLRPLRDQRLLQRYLRAVEQGRATGWHLLVYGVTLEVFSIPLRQGLLNFAKQTLGAYLHAGSCRLNLPEKEADEILAEALRSLRPGIESLFAESVEGNTHRG